MSQPSSKKPGRRPGILSLVAPVILAASIPFVVAGCSSNAPSAQAKDAKPDQAPGQKKLTGAELYQVHCNRCHAERYPTEFTPTQWKTLMTHMRVRADLPAVQAKAILKYMQEESSN